MASRVVKFQAVDGSEWWAESDADARDALVRAVERAVEPLGPEVNDIAFANGGGYVPHADGDVLEAKRRLIAIAAKVVPHTVWSQPVTDIHPLGSAGRLIDDVAFTALNRAWHRLCCIDGHSREWGQPYYAINPNKGTPREWRPAP